MESQQRIRKERRVESGFWVGGHPIGCVSRAIRWQPIGEFVYTELRVNYTEEFMEGIVIGKESPDHPRFSAA